MAPPKPSMQVVPTEVCKSSTSIQIRFRKNYFSEANGPVSDFEKPLSADTFVLSTGFCFFQIVSYAVIVAEDDSKNASGLEMPSWRDVQAYSVWPPYQVMEPYYPFFNSSVEDFTVGGDTCDIRSDFD